VSSSIVASMTSVLARGSRGVRGSVVGLKARAEAGGTIGVDAGVVGALPVLAEPAVAGVEEACVADAWAALV